VIFDSQLKFNNFIQRTACSANYQLRCISRIRQCLNKTVAAQLVQSLVLSRLDYCNSVLAGLPKCATRPLQLVLNSAARLVFLCKRSCHVSPLLQSLDWLPVRERVDRKILSLTHKALHGKAPSYLSDLLCAYAPSRCLRSSSARLLSISFSRLKTVGDRCFSSVGPRLWNSLPLCVRSTSSYLYYNNCVRHHLARALIADQALLALY
jgi:hypothetical protein